MPLPLRLFLGPDHLAIDFSQLLPSPHPFSAPRNVVCTKIAETLDLWVSVLAHPEASSLSGQKKRQLSSSFQGKSIYSCRHRRSAPPSPTSMMQLLFHSWWQNFCRSYYLCNLRRGGGGRDGQGGQL